MHANIHLNAITRSAGKSALGAAAYRSGSSITSRSVVAAAAYRSGSLMNSKREERSFDFRGKGNVEESAILAPANAPDWVNDRQAYWNAVEAREKRKDALLAKEAVLVLPRNLSHDQHRQVVERWATKNLVEQRGLVVDYAIHTPDASDGGKNPHAHVLYYPRPFDENGEWSKHKLTGYKTKNTVDGKAVLEELRQSYEDELNKAANENKAQAAKVFDLRSYKKRGINRIPQPKIGWRANALERKGIDTSRGQLMRKTMAKNKALAGRRKYVRTFSKFGNPHRKRAGLGERAREDVANTYYQVMYGDGIAEQNESKGYLYER